MSEVQDVNQRRNISNKTGLQDHIQLSAKPFFYTWTLGNFSECLKFPDAEILSPEFQFADAKWRLLLKTFCKNDKLDKIKFRLVKSEKCGSGYYIKHKFSLLNADGSYVTKEATSSFRPESVWGHRLSFKYQGKNKNSSFIVKDKLTVDCELFVLSSSSVASNGRISVNRSDNLRPKQVDKAMDLSPIFVSRGLIQSRSSSSVPKTGNKSAHPSSHLFSRRNRRMELSPFKAFRNVTEILFPLFMIFVFLKHGCPNETSMNGESMLNMTEVNALIIDSTLKIRSIAEVLNLTDIKIKSSELLDWYRENYNISDKHFASSTEKISPIIISDHQILNASTSTSSMYEKAITNNSTEIIENEH